MRDTTSDSEQLRPLSLFRQGQILLGLWVAAALAPTWSDSAGQLGQHLQRLGVGRHLTAENLPSSGLSHHRANQRPSP